MSKKEYTIQELSELFGVSLRTIQRKLSEVSEIVKSQGKQVIVPFEIAQYLQRVNEYSVTSDKPLTTSDKLMTASDAEEDEYEHIEAFTEEEYSEFHKRLSEYPLLKEQIEDLKEQIVYHKKQYETLMQTLQNITHSNELALNNLIQRNFIEAKEKGLDK